MKEPIGCDFTSARGLILYTFVLESQVMNSIAIKLADAEKEPY